jgi:hypothetical protein
VIGNLQFKAANSCTLPAHLIGLKWEHKKIALFAYIFNIANSGMKPAKILEVNLVGQKNIMLYAHFDNRLVFGPGFRLHNGKFYLYPFGRRHRPDISPLDPR